METRCVDHVTPLYLQKLALTSPTGGGRSVGIVRVRTKATEFVLSLGLVLRDFSFDRKVLNSLSLGFCVCSILYVR